MNRILATAVVLMLMAVSWVPAASQSSSRMTLEFSEENPESLEVREESEPFEDDESIRFRARSGDIVRFGEDIVIEKGERIHGDVVAVGGSVTVRGTVDGDVAALGGDVHIEPGGEVRGEAVSVGGKVDQSGSGRVSGTSVSLPDMPNWFFAAPTFRFFRGLDDLLGEIFTLGLLLLIAWGLSKLAPERTERAADYIRARPLMSLLWGLLAIAGVLPSAIAVVLVAALLCITIIGIPVAVLLLLAYFLGLIVLMFFGYLVGSAVVGKWLLQRIRPGDGEPTLLRSLFAGVLLIGILEVLAVLLKVSWLLGTVGSSLGGFLAFISGALFVIVWLFGTGAVLGSRAGQAFRPPAATAPGTSPPALPPPVTPSPGTAPPPPSAPEAPPAPPPPAPGGSGESSPS